MRPQATLAHALVGIALCLQPGPARAGPPLISDDPNTIGSGMAQPIFATSVLHRGSRTIFRGLILDATVGVVDSLDVTLISSLIATYDSEMTPHWEPFGDFTPGIKWEFFRTDRGSLCFSPAFSYATIAPERVLLLLPIQGELAVGDIDAAIGFDVGYLPIFNGPDEWFVTVYGRSAVTKRLALLGEIWALAATPSKAVDLGVSFGMSYRIVGDELVLIAAISPGLVSFNRQRLDVRAYLGFQYTFERPRRAGSHHEMAHERVTEKAPGMVHE